MKKFRTSFLNGYSRKDVDEYVEFLVNELDSLKEETARMLEEQKQKMSELELRITKEKEEKEVLEKTSASKAGSAAEKAAEAKIRDLKRIRKTVNAIIDKLSDEEGWLDCGKLGDQLSKRLPDFDVRNYGYSKLTPFIKSLGDYDVQKISMGGGQKQIYFRMKTKKTGKA